MINYILVITSILSPLIPICLSFYKFKAFNTQLKVLFILLCVSFLSDISSVIVLFYGKDPSLFFNIYTFLKLILSSIVIIKGSEQFNKSSRIINYSILVGTVVVSIISIILENNIEKSNLILNLLTGLFVIYLSIQWFYFLLIDMTVKSLKNYYMFWIISGFLISDGFSLFVNISADYIHANEDNSAYLLWTIIIISNIIFNIFIAIGITKVQKT